MIKYIVNFQLWLLLYFNVNEFLIAFHMFRLAI